MNNKILLLSSIFIIGALAAIKFIYIQKAGANGTERVHALIPDDAGAMAEWSDASRKAVNMMKEKYGVPSSRTSSMMIWENVTPWKRVVVHAQAVRHNFPMPHADVLEQTVDYRVPIEKFSELAQYDGSIVCSRTKGEMSVMCDKEPMNFLALNLADEIIRGNKNVNSARDFYANAVMAFMNGTKDPYTQRLRFEIEKENTADPDRMSPVLDNKEIMKINAQPEKSGMNEK